MISPTTTLDPRFSDPSATPTSWGDTCQVLETAGVFWITTVRVDGRPHVTPLVAVWFDGALHFCTGPTEQKARNLESNRQVVLTTGCNQWGEGLDVVVEGEAVRITDEERLTHLAAAWRTKWDGQWIFEARDGSFHHPEGGEAWVFSVAPSTVLAFGKGTFSHTRHRF